MGIYRTTKFTAADGQELRDLTHAMGREVTIEIGEPGLTWTATLKPEDWTKKRTDCFCCSCGEREGSDPACRNHGWDGQRPCEHHRMPGKLRESSEDYDMPISVQEVRRLRQGRGA